MALATWLLTGLRDAAEIGLDPTSMLVANLVSSYAAA